MKKELQPSDIKIVDLTAAFDKEDFDQVIMPAVAAGDVKVTTGADAATLKDYAVIKVAADQVGLNLQVDLDGTEQFVLIENAGTAGVLAGKADVYKVRGIGVPVPAVVNDTKYTR